MLLLVIFCIPSLQMGSVYGILPCISTCIACKPFISLTELFEPLTFIDVIFIDSKVHSLSVHILLNFLS